MPLTEPSSAVKARRPGKTPFDVSVNENTKPPVLLLRGDVDVAVAERLHEQLKRLVENGHAHIIVDCSAVTYFDSTGLSELVWASRSLPEHGRVKLIGCSPRLVKLLSITGLDNIFDLDMPEAA